MSKLVTFGRVAEERVHQGTIFIEENGTKTVAAVGKLDYLKIGSGTVTILKTARITSPALHLEIIAETLAGENERAARSLFNEYGISCNPALTNPDPETPTSWAQWIIDGAKKTTYENNLPGPTDHYVAQLGNLPLLGTDDAFVMCAEYTTDHWSIFKDFILANKKNGARIWMNPNIRQKDPSLQETYRQNFAAQLQVSELVVMAHTDLGFLFDHRDSFETNLGKFKTTFPNFKGIAVITRGEQGPLILNQATGRDRIGEPPPKLDTVVSAVGAGDAFSGGLFAQLLPRLLRGERLSIGDVAACIPDAHRAAAMHMSGEAPKLPIPFSRSAPAYSS